VENKAEIPEASPRGTCEAGLDVYKRWLFLLVALDPRRRGSGFHPNYGPKLIGWFSGIAPASEAGNGTATNTRSAITFSELLDNFGHLISTEPRRTRETGPRHRSRAPADMALACRWLRTFVITDGEAMWE